MARAAVVDRSLGAPRRSRAEWLLRAGAWPVALALVIVACRGEPRSAAPETSTSRSGRTKASDVSLAPSGAFILPAARAATALSQCSRPVPATPDSFWTPRAEDVAALDSLLLTEVGPRFERAWARAYASSDPPELEPPRYYRQYAGLIHGSRRTIYVNGFMPHVDLAAPSTGADAGEDSARGALRESLARDGYVVCDGGEWYFGVEYEPATRRFRNFHFNGRG